MSNCFSLQRQTNMEIVRRKDIVPIKQETTTEEGIPIQSLTKEDMMEIAQITGGTFYEPSYQIQIGSVSYLLNNDPFHGVILSLRKLIDGSDTVILDVEGGLISQRFLSKDRIVKNETSISFIAPKQILTIGQGEIKYTITAPYIQIIESDKRSCAPCPPSSDANLLT